MDGDMGSDKEITYQPAKVPFTIERHLDFIDISEGGSLLLGSSNLTGKYWNGSIFYYKDPDLAPLEDKWVSGHNCESGVTAGKFLDSDNKVIVGEDSGVLTILDIIQLETEDFHFVPQMYATHHDSSITSIDVSREANQAVSAGLDLCINVWDIASLTGVHRYCPAHARSITCVATAENNFPLFASSSLDGVALLWDSRIAKPAQVLKEDDRCGLSCISWLDGEKVVAGSQSGVVFTLDTRSHAQPLSSLKAFNRPLHAIAPNNKYGLVAMCGDSSNVVIWDPTSDTLVESERRHSGMVRGLSWYGQVLYSCGMDRQVISHSTLLHPSSPA